MKKKYLLGLFLLLGALFVIGCVEQQNQSEPKEISCKTIRLEGESVPHKCVDKNGEYESIDQCKGLRDGTQIYYECTAGDLCEVVKNNINCPDFEVIGGDYSTRIGPQTCQLQGKEVHCIPEYEKPYTE